MMRKQWVYKVKGGLVFLMIGLAQLQAQSERKANKQVLSEEAGMETMWDTATIQNTRVDTKWFKEAKFGLFIHWGLYSKLGGVWNDKRYYGSGEWIMNRARIPVKAYAEEAKSFNPVDFDADSWAQLAADAGVKYLVITAKHHEGFSMFDSKVTDYDIVDATPFKKDPMKDLSKAVRAKGIKFGFYYSQFQDWYEPNGGKNTWDFDESKKDYQRYYNKKAIPQIKELLTGYGPIGLIWFDTPGGMTKEQTKDFVDGLRKLQPDCLFSSRVGQGLGDYKDYGDSEIPAVPMEGVWESIYTHNDTWGYIEHDMNFKSPKEIIQLLATVASRGGNLMLNISPDGNGRIPAYSAAYLRATGQWLKKNGSSIYKTTAGFIPAQPWGVTTQKPGQLFMHIFNFPDNNCLLVPNCNLNVSSIRTMEGNIDLPYKQKEGDLVIDLSTLKRTEEADQVVVVSYKGEAPKYVKGAPVTVSQYYGKQAVNAPSANLEGQAVLKSLTYSYYYGDWKHTDCITDLHSPSDAAVFNLRFTQRGDYRLILSYSADNENAGREGVLEIANQKYLFQTLFTSAFNKKAPLLFIDHAVGIYHVDKPGVYQVKVRPDKQGGELFKLQSIKVEPLKW